MTETIPSLINERAHWLSIDIAKTNHDTYAIVLKIDGYYANESDAHQMRDYWHDRLVEAGFPVPERIGAA